MIVIRIPLADMKREITSFRHKLKNYYLPSFKEGLLLYLNLSTRLIVCL